MSSPVLIGAVLALPLVSILVPAWEVPLLPAATASDLIALPESPSGSTAATRWQSLGALPEEAPAIVDDTAGSDASSSREDTAAALGAATDHAARSPAVERRQGPVSESVRVHRLELLIVAWSTGVALLFGQLLAGLGRVAWIDRRARPVTSGALH